MQSIIAQNRQVIEFLSESIIINNNIQPIFRIKFIIKE